MLLCGAENAQLFSPIFKLRLEGLFEERSYLVADDGGFADVRGSWIEIQAPQPQVVLDAYRTLDTRKDALPLGVRVRQGKGTAVVCPGPITSAYGFSRTPVIRSIARLAGELHRPAVGVDGNFPALEIALRKKNGQTLIHLINSAGASVTGEFRHTGVVPRTGPLRLRLRLPAAPSQVVLEPGGVPLTGEYESGEWRGLLPDLHVHSMVRVAS